MIIKKSTSVKASSKPSKSNNSSSYVEAQKHIRCAIDILGKEAKDNVLAKESIANLSVVLLDLM